VRLFQVLLSLVFLNAWLSLASQVDVLLGHRGLMPIEPLVERLQQRGVGFSEFPSLLLLGASDDALHTLLAWGIALSIVSLMGVYPRLAFAANTASYLSVAIAGRNFLAFQWDNLLLECGLLASFLSSDGKQRWAPFLFRVLLFKLYFESGIAKWQSPIRDWQDGSAMTYYYETAPLPTWIAWYAHHLPAWWHHFESRATLVLELVIPFGIFGPRKLRLFAFAAFTLFQIFNAATANYGFFCYLAVVLGVFLLDDADIERARARLARAAQLVPAPAHRLAARAAALARFRARRCRPFCSRPPASGSRSPAQGCSRSCRSPTPTPTSASPARSSRS
jgi:uncharacterized membrane protein YphA (DoxX/SURF4 family)